MMAGGLAGGLAAGGLVAGGLAGVPLAGQLPAAFPGLGAPLLPPPWEVRARDTHDLCELPVSTDQEARRDSRAFAGPPHR